MKFKPVFVLPLILMVSGCLSKPAGTVLSRGPSSAKKATVDLTNPNLIEIQVLVAKAPRRGQEIESAVILTPGVQECLRQTPEIRDSGFSVAVEGYISYTGLVDKVRVTSNSKDLKTCLKPQIQAIGFGRGKMGEFKLQIVRPSGTEIRPKPLYLDLSEDKKLQ